MNHLPVHQYTWIFWHELVRKRQEKHTHGFDTFIFSTVLVLLMNSWRIFLCAIFPFSSLLEESCKSSRGNGFGTGFVHSTRFWANAVVFAFGEIQLFFVSLSWLIAKREVAQYVESRDRRILSRWQDDNSTGRFHLRVSNSSFSTHVTPLLTWNGLCLHPGDPAFLRSHCG